MITLLALSVVPIFADGDQAPAAISPGGDENLAVIESRCPTFSWGEISASSQYELVVFDVSNEPTEGEVEPDNRPALQITVATRGLSWTPAGDQCFTRGRRYAWSVRAKEADRAGGAWSKPRWFQVSTTPSTAELRRALAILTAHEERVSSALASPGPAEAAGGAAPDLVDDRPGSRPDEPSHELAGIGHKALVMSPAAATAIRVEPGQSSGRVFGAHGVSGTTGAGSAGAVGQSTATTGATAGVIGQVASAAGTAGIFENAAGGPILRGLVNGLAVLNLAGTGNLSATAFSGNGSGLTGVNAVTLGGNGPAAFAAAAHLHDDRYFTETELTTAGGGGSLHWDNLIGVPAGLADGVDNDTTYTAGNGLILEGTRFRLGSWNGSPTDTGSTILDTGLGDPGPGWMHSLTVGSDGLGIVSYYSPRGDSITPRGILGVAHCSDVPCDSATVTILDRDVTSVGWDPEIGIGGDGLGLISYHDRSAGFLKVAHCDNLACTSATITTIDSSARVGIDSTMTVGTDGRGLISYYDETNSVIKMAHCDNAACTTATITTLDSAPCCGAGQVAMGADGLALVSYPSATRAAVKVAHCDNAACTSATIATPDSPGGVSVGSLAIGSDGLGLVAYNNTVANSLKMAHCDNLLCSSSTLTTLDSSGVSGGLLTIGSDGLGLVAYRDNTTKTLKTAHCSNAACTAATVSTLVGSGDLRAAGAMIGGDGLALINQYDLTTGDIRVAHCRNLACTSAQLRTLGNGNTFGTTIDMTAGSDGFALLSYLDRNDNSLKAVHCSNPFCVPFFRRR